MKKVIVRLGNGLGNQLFTYAAAYSFAKKNNAELYVDDESGFHKRHKYELHNFNISAKIVAKRYKFLGFLKDASKNHIIGNNHITKETLIIAQLILTNFFSLFIVYLFRLCTSF